MAAPIAGTIIGDSLRAMGVKPRKKQMEKEITPYLDTPMIKVPDLKGLTKKGLLEQLDNLKLDVSGKGETVIRQDPQPGTKVEEGATIRVYMN